MFPQATALAPAARRMAVSMATVVVLPLVPVTASHTGGSACSAHSRQASSTSPITSIPARAAAASTGASGRQPGAVTTSAVSGGGVRRSCATRRPGSASATDRSRPTSASVTVTTAPSASSALATGGPVTPAPVTRTCAPASVTSAPAAVAEPVAVEQPEAEHAGGGPEQPESDDHRGFRPPGEFEVMVERGHSKYSAAGGAERGDLHNHRQRLHHEQPADDHHQQFGTGGHREPREQAAQREGTRVAHEDLGRCRVPPQEADAGAHRGGRDQRQVQRVAHVEAAGQAGAGGDGAVVR